MTNEQINVAIARACGWKSKEEINGVPWFWIRTKSDYTIQISMEPLNYCGDLNAMHEAEKALKNVTQQIDYTNYLYDMECENQERTGRWMPYSISARQRAEAFLRTLGIWGETK